MYQIRLESGEYLDGNFDFQFELNNQVFTTASTDILPGSFTFPVTVALTPRMKLLFNNPHNVNNAKNWIQYPNVQVLAYNVPLFEGTLSINAATDNSLKISIVAQPMLALKKVLLQELDLGGPYTTEGLDWENYMLRVAQRPDDYNFVFTPVFQGILGELTHYNKFDNIFGGAPYFDVPNTNISPFVRLSYLLKQGFQAEDTGYSFVNLFQKATEIELNRLYLFNNADVRIADGITKVLPTSFKLNRHVPKIRFTELLKKVMAQNGLGLFTNLFRKEIVLKPLQDVLTATTMIDWTSYQIRKMEIVDDGKEAPVYFNYKNLPLKRNAPSIESCQVVDTYPEYEAITAPGFYYIEANSALFETAIPVVAPNVGYVHYGVRLEDTGPEYDPGMDSLYSVSTRQYYLPDGSASRYELNDAGTLEWVESPYPLALLLYRGMNEVGLYEYPYAANHVWLDPGVPPKQRSKITHNGTVIQESNTSMNWQGPNGLYERQHRLWNEALRNGKHVTLQFAIPVTKLQAFTFDQKVRVQEMDYLVKKLRVGKCLGDNKVQVQAEMVSVI